jgi:hypothetical protein
MLTVQKAIDEFYHPLYPIYAPTKCQSSLPLFLRGEQIVRKCYVILRPFAILIYLWRDRLISSSPERSIHEAVRDEASGVSLFRTRTRVVYVQSKHESLCNLLNSHNINLCPCQFPIDVEQLLRGCDDAIQASAVAKSKADHLMTFEALLLTL